MPLEMPKTDSQVGKCGLPALEAGRGGTCDRPGVDRIGVTTVDEADNDDYDYEYSSEFRIIGSLWPVMVGRCQDHKDLHAREFESERDRIAKREADQAKAAEKIRGLEAQLEAAKQDYPGTWRG